MPNQCFLPGVATCSKYIRVFILSVFLSALSISSTLSAQPNIVFILADDQGWNHHSVAMFEDEASANSAHFSTPNIQRIADAGMRFSSAYSAAPMCNPSRRSLHVGRSNAQVSHTGLSARQQEEALTIGEMMQSSGYRTAHFGKWSPGPSAAGLDFYNVTDGNFNNGAGNENELGNPKQIFGLTERAESFIEESVAAEKPFYMQISHFAPHTATHSLPETLEKWRTRSQSDNPNPEMSAMTEDLDTGVGAILDKIQQLGIADNTYIIYSSDHGQTPGALANTPLTSGKGTLWEGGIRVPFIVSGPGIAHNTFSNTRTVSLDLFPTFAELGGFAEPLPEEIEGGSLVPVWLGSSDEIQRPREELVFHFPSGSGQADFQPMSTVYLDQYKLVKLYNTNELLLFNVSEDLGEKNDLASAMPEKTEELHQLLLNYFDDLNVEDVSLGGGGNDGGMGNMGGMAMAMGMGG